MDQIQAARDEWERRKMARIIAEGMPLPIDLEIDLEKAEARQKRIDEWLDHLFDEKPKRRGCALVAAGALFTILVVIVIVMVVLSLR